MSEVVALALGYCKGFGMNIYKHWGHEEKEDEEDSEEDEELKVCQVCGDQASGYHFNVMSCEGCKGFFRRAMKRPVSFSCPFQGSCLINKSNRRHCQACRLHKCQNMGMRKELIMSDEELEQRRRLIREKKHGVTVTLTGQQEALIHELLNAQRKTFDLNFSHFTHFRPSDRHMTSVGSATPLCIAQLGVGVTDRRVFQNLPHIADLSTYMIQQFISFAKYLSHFKQLSIEDQISLLKGATFEVVQIRFNMLFNDKSGLWECGPLTYCMDDAARAGFQPHLLDPLMNFHYCLRALRLDDSEYVLMQAISLFSPDRVSVLNHKSVDKHQEMLAITLQAYIDAKRTSPDKHLLFPKIMSCLTEMRSMSEEYTKQVLEIHDIQPDLPPLMMEVFSKDS